MPEHLHNTNSKEEEKQQQQQHGIKTIAARCTTSNQKIESMKQN